jgi:hypothetical protein
MATYWYLSADKLRALDALEPSLVRRLNTRARLGLAGASVEVGLDNGTTQALGRSARQIESKLRRQGKVRDVAEFINGSPPAVYFDSNGPTCRAVIAEMFWVAMLHGNVAVLLVGSVANTVGAQHMTPPPSNIMPSADPVGALRELIRRWPKAIPTLSPDEVFGPSEGPVVAAQQLMASPWRLTTMMNPAADISDSSGAENPARVEARQHIDDLAFAWTALLRRSLDLAGDDIVGLPRVQSVSQYVARHNSDHLRSGWLANVTSLVLGTPIYVKQVS